MMRAPTPPAPRSKLAIAPIFADGSNSSMPTRVGIAGADAGFAVAASFRRRGPDDHQLGLAMAPSDSRLRRLAENLADRSDASPAKFARHPHRDREFQLHRIDLITRRHRGKFPQRGNRAFEMAIGKRLQQILRAAARISQPEAREDSMRAELRGQFRRAAHE